jgi:general secretion pathway protein I
MRPGGLRRYRRQSAGFSLLEILVAFSILALSLAVLMQIFSGGMRNTQAAASYSRAADLAESVLTRVGVDLPLIQGAQNDNERGFHWDLYITPYQITVFVSPPQGLEFYQITARVSWGDAHGAHSLELHSLRAAQALQ